MKAILSAILLVSISALGVSAAAIASFEPQVSASFLSVHSSSVGTHASSVSSLSHASKSAQPSVDPRIERWSRMRVALPDGIGADNFKQDTSLKEDINVKEQIVPMIVVEESEFPLPSLVNGPMYKHQKSPSDKDTKPGYKQFSISKDAASFRPAVITPFSPEIQADIKQKESTVVVTMGRKYRKFVGVSDKGERKVISVPDITGTYDSPAAEFNEQEVEERISQKTIIGLDKSGKIRYLKVPSYDRANE